MNDYPLRVCYFGTYRANYSRNQIMIAGLRANGVEVIECRVSLWHGIEDREQVAGGGWARFSFFKRVFVAYSQLLKKYISSKPKYDVMVLGYPGQLDVFLARLLTWWHRKPLVLDMFMSVYLVALERGLDTRSKISIYLLRKLEWIASRLPDLLICDTEAYREWYAKTYGLSPERFRLVPTGADDRTFKPIDVNKSDDGVFKVLYYGTFIPNHGVKYIIEAANLLKDYPEIQIELVGDGPDKEEALCLAEKYNLQNVIFTDWINKDDLPQKIAEADLLLGVFGSTPQSLMTVQNKIYEGLAMGKPVVTGHAPQVESQFSHGKHIYFCERENGASLAESIIKLSKNLQNVRQIAFQGYKLFLEKYSIQDNGFLFKSHLLKNCCVG